MAIPSFIYTPTSFASYLSLIFKGAFYYSVLAVFIDLSVKIILGETMLFASC